LRPAFIRHTGRFIRLLARLTSFWIGQFQPSASYLFPIVNFSFFKRQRFESLFTTSLKQLNLLAK
jgi:hypothetical protein